MEVKCPICKKEVRWKDSLYRPFCSERCKLIDLGSWATEKYRIEGEDIKGDEKGDKGDEAEEA